MPRGKKKREDEDEISNERVRLDDSGDAMDRSHKRNDHAVVKNDRDIGDEEVDHENIEPERVSRIVEPEELGEGTDVIASNELQVRSRSPIFMEDPL